MVHRGTANASSGRCRVRALNPEICRALGESFGQRQHLQRRSALASQLAAARAKFGFTQLNQRALGAKACKHGELHSYSLLRQ